MSSELSFNSCSLLVPEVFLMTTRHFCRFLKIVPVDIRWFSSHQFVFVAHIPRLEKSLERLAAVVHYNGGGSVPWRVRPRWVRPVSGSTTVGPSRVGTDHGVSVPCRVRPRWVRPVAGPTTVGPYSVGEFACRCDTVGCGRQSQEINHDKRSTLLCVTTGGVSPTPPREGGGPPPHTFV